MTGSGVQGGKFFSSPMGNKSGLGKMFSDKLSTSGGSMAEGVDETELIEGLNPETWYGNLRGQTCVRTSYNKSIRDAFAGIGFTYDPEQDIFIDPSPELADSFNGD